MEILDSVFVYRLAEGERLIHHGRYHSHSDNEFEIHFFVDGNGTFLLNNTRYTISGNTLFLVGPHEFHSIIPRQITKPITYYAVLFSLSENDDDRLYRILNHILERMRSMSVDPINKFNFEEIRRLALSDLLEFRLSGQYLLMSHLYRWFSETILPDTTDVGAYNDGKKRRLIYVKKVTAIMEREIHGNMTVEQMAFKIGLSTEHFIRLFKEEIKMTPYQYFIRLKIQAASAALVSTNKSVQKIAEEYSFENQFHFSRVFKKCTGFPPSVYKKLYSAD